MTCINANKKKQSYHISLVSILFISQITGLDFFYTSVWVFSQSQIHFGCLPVCPGNRYAL